MTWKEILEFSITVGKYSFSFLDLIEVIVILLIARMFIWVFLKIFERLFRKNKIDIGRQYATTQFVKYIVYFFAVLTVLSSIGVNLSLLLAGSAALLVGIGLALQQTFTDLISGIILLIEGTVAVGDIVTLDGTVGIVRKISLRTSRVETRDHIVIIVPNSQLVTEKVTNWSHNNMSTRFSINVGVAYGSDVNLVTKILLDCAKKHGEILSNPVPEVQFVDFGSSSLDFTLF